MGDFQSFSLTKTQSLISVLAPLILVMFFFFSLQTGVAANLEKIENNKDTIEKLEARMESMNTTLQENNTNIKLIQLQMVHMAEKMEQVIAVVGEK